MGATTDGRVMSHASATCDGVADSRSRQRVERREDRVPARIQEFLHPLPARALAEVRFRPVLAGEKTGGEREVGDDADAFPHAQVLQRTLEARTLVQVVVRLQRGVPRQAGDAACFQCLRQARAR